MGARGPAPKNPKTRQRRNAVAGQSTLKVGAEQDLPTLDRAPARPRGVDWLPATEVWWKALWKSPMAPEFLKMDLQAIERLAQLIDLRGRLLLRIRRLEELNDRRYDAIRMREEAVRELRGAGPDFALEVLAALEQIENARDAVQAAIKTGHSLSMDLLKMEAELARQEQRFGLTPLDRRRLGWTKSDDDTFGPKKPKTTALPPPDDADDPRKIVAIR